MQHPRMQTDGIRPRASAERVASLDPSRASPRGLEGLQKTPSIKQLLGVAAAFGSPQKAGSGVQFLTPTGEGTRPRSDASMQRLSIEAARHPCRSRPSSRVIELLPRVANASIYAPHRSGGLSAEDR
jgi:hypothetical protein